MSSSVPNGGEPDYFGAAHTASSKSQHDGNAPNATPAADSHPWTQLVGQGGMKTALPDFRASSRAFIPPTPAATQQSLPKNASTASLPQNFNKASRNNSSTLSLPQPSKSKSTEDFSRYKGIDIDGLARVLTPALSQPSPSHEDVLVLDIRPSTSFTSARVLKSINICAPSTLLKRPAITVERIEQEMLPSAADKKRFMRWRNDTSNASSHTQSNGEVGIRKIVVLDTDTTRVDGVGNATAGGGGPCLIGVLKKFEAAGFTGDLCWLVGGFNRLAHSDKAKNLIDSSQPQHVCPDKSDKAIDPQDSPVQDKHSNRPRSMTLSSLQPDASIDSHKHDTRSFSLVQPRGLSLEAFQSQSTVAGWPGQSQAASRENANVDTLNSSQRASGKKQPSACANPFFDNIRQNRELQHGITERIPMDLPTMVEAEIAALPPFFQDLVRMSSDDRAQKLAEAFFDVEKAEQNRLLATMQQHSALSGPQSFGSAPSAASGGHQPGKQSHAFPFSIAAALERGADNRYNNIWTYEHSRVRLNKPQSEQDPGSDYVNASYLVPASQFDCNRRFIATQAPLPTTFEAFWTAVWEQNSRVVVMLTREHESGRIQSHPYWLESKYGPHIRLDKLEEVVLDQYGREMPPEQCADLAKDNTDGGQLFPNMVVNEPEKDLQDRVPTTVRRIFRLRNLADRGAAVRRIVHLQYVAWPDYHIPDAPDSLLSFMNMADTSQHAADTELRQQQRGLSQPTLWSQPVAGPMVVHCSAGVGRTGAFIAINTALDVVRRCRRRSQGRNPLGPWEDSDASSRRISSAGTADDTPEIDMLSSDDGRLGSRSERRSLKRDLSPAAMDIDTGSPRGGRDITSPTRLLRNRSSGGSSDTDTTSHSRIGAEPESWSSSSSSATDTPPTTFQSMHLPASSSSSASASKSGETFSNPFSSATFNFNLHASGVGSSRVGSAGSPMQQQTVAPSAGQEPHQPPRAYAFGNSISSGSDSWRQTSSPFTEVSTPSVHSARSSFSSAAGGSAGPPFSNSLSPDPHGTNSDAALAGLDSFQLAISRNKAPMTLQSMSSPSPPDMDNAQADNTTTTVADNTASTFTGSNEPTPFDFSSSKANDFRFHRPSGSANGGSSDDDSDHALTLSLDARLSSTYRLPKTGLPRSTSTESTTAASAVAAAEKADEAYRTGEDMIRKIAETAREQRMSLIQTGRQYVFVYSAVLAGILDELHKEGIH